MSVPDSNDPENNTQEPGEKRKFLQRFRRQKPADSPSEIAAQEVTVNEQQLDAGLENNQVKENKPKEISKETEKDNKAKKSEQNAAKMVVQKEKGKEEKVVAKDQKQEQKPK